MRIFKRSVGDQLAAFKIDETENNGRSAEIHGDAVDGTGGAFDFDAIDEDAISVARDCGIELEWLVVSRQAQCVPFNPHVAAAHGVATNSAACCSNGGLAGEAKISFEVTLRFGHGRESVHALDHLDHALLALALLPARCGHVDAEEFSVIEEREASLRFDRLPVDGESDGHSRL